LSVGIPTIFLLLPVIRLQSYRQWVLTMTMGHWQQWVWVLTTMGI